MLAFKELSAPLAQQVHKGLQALKALLERKVDKEFKVQPELLGLLV